jgi:PKD repeat protein
MSMVRTIVALGSSLLVAACGLEQSTPPPLTGPSDFALSVTLAAVPDQVPRDGSSQSVVTVTVRDASGRPVAGQRLSVSTSLGTLLQTDIVTGSDGRASFAFVAPAAGSVGDSALIRVVPIGTNAENAEPRTLRISFAGVPNATAPGPSFTVTPASPEVGQVTTFNASASTDEGGPCLDACTYTWALGTEAVRTGRIITYAFQNPGIQSVTLTMRDAAGTSASAQQNVTVTAAARPTVTFAVTPAAPVAGQLATFTATSTVAANHRITRFDWNWGDGSTSQTANAAITHAFNAPGSYVVNVTVTDDLGQTASSSASVTVGSGVTASFTFSPTDPEPGERVQFDGSSSASTGGATIVEWTWDFGDGSTVTESDPRTEHAFSVPAGATSRTYRVRLTVKDSAGRTGLGNPPQGQQDLTVTAPAGP